MSTPPLLLRGVADIATFLCIDPFYVEAHHRSGTIPTFVVDGEVCATPSGLLSWCYLVASGEIPNP